MILLAGVPLWGETLCGADGRRTGVISAKACIASWGPRHDRDGFWQATRCTGFQSDATFGETYMIDLLELATTSHLVKLFDGSAIAEEAICTLRAVLRSAPSSFNIQATHYVMAASQAARERIAKAVQGDFILNAPKILTASHVIVFCSRIDLPAIHMDAVAAQERSDGRFPNPSIEARWRELVNHGLATHRYDLKDLPHWIEKQTYLALGIALLSAAELGIHALPMEGFDRHVLDDELDLRPTGYTSTVLLALGRQSPDDYVIGAPKSRLPDSHFFTNLG
jgi:nitroreductase / dihydropteridine reductase